MSAWLHVALLQNHIYTDVFILHLWSSSLAPSERLSFRLQISVNPPKKLKLTALMLCVFFSVDGLMTSLSKEILVISYYYYYHYNFQRRDWDTGRPSELYLNPWNNMNPWIGKYNGNSLAQLGHFLWKWEQGEWEGER